MALMRSSRLPADIFSPFFDDLMAPAQRRSGDLLRVPDTDVVETETEIRVTAELAGLNPDDVDVSLENNILTVSGEKKEEREEGERAGTYHLTERRFGRFSRSFVLPREVEQDRIEAHFHNGVLTVMIPKTEKARRRRIEIRGESDGGRRIEPAET